MHQPSALTGKAIAEPTSGEAAIRSRRRPTKWRYSILTRSSNSRSALCRFLRFELSITGPGMSRRPDRSGRPRQTQYHRDGPPHLVGAAGEISLVREFEANPISIAEASGHTEARMSHDDVPANVTI